MSVHPYVPVPLCPWALMSARLCPAPFFLRPYVRFRPSLLFSYIKLTYLNHIETSNGAIDLKLNIIKNIIQKQPPNNQTWAVPNYFCNELLYQITFFVPIPPVLFSGTFLFLFDQYFFFFLEGNNQNFGAKTQTHSKYLNKVEVLTPAVQLAGVKIVSDRQFAGQVWIVGNSKKSYLLVFY